MMNYLMCFIGMDIVKALEERGTDSGRPRAICKIADCGQL